MEGLADGSCASSATRSASNPDRVLAITGLDTSARSGPSSRPSTTTPTGLSPCSATTSRPWRPVLGPTDTVMTRYLAHHAADCPLSIEPLEFAFRVGFMGHSALAKTFARAERFAMMLFMRP
jgi:hypothetical protein